MHVREAQKALADAQKVYNEMQQKLTVLQTALGAAAELKEADSTLMEVKAAQERLDNALSVLYKACGRKEEKTADLTSYTVQAELQNGMLSVDLPPNRGTVVYITQ